MSETTIAAETAASTPPAVASAPPAPPTAIDTPPATQLLIEHSLGAPTGVPGELLTRKLYTRVHTATLRQSKKIAPLLPPPADEPLRVALDDASLRPEALVHALECVALRRGPDAAAQLADVEQLLRAAAWLAVPALAAACETRLRREVRVENALALAAAAHRCKAHGLLAECFFVLKEHFLSNGAGGGGAGSPQLGPRGISQGRLALPHGVWRPVRAAGEASHASVLTPRPRYTMCLLERVRRDDAPTRFTLRTEHDGAALLVAEARDDVDGYVILAPDEGGEASSEPLSAGSPLLRGLVTSTWMGARHAICDAGVPPDGPSDFPWPPQRELAIVRYAPNLLQGAPHALTLWVRAVAAADDGDAEGNGGGDGSGGGGGGGGEGGSDDEWIELRNVSPEWNEAMGSFTLPFYSRAKLASKKNFHVVDPANPDDILLLLGKLKKEGDVTTFALDFCRPISALVAFGAALSAFEAEA